MNFVLFFLVGAGINGLTLGLTCLLLVSEVIKNRLTRRGVTVAMFIISAIVAIVFSMYVDNIYGSLGYLCVLSGYIVNIMLFCLSIILVSRAE